MPPPVENQGKPTCVSPSSYGRVGASQGRLSAWSPAWGGDETSGLRFLISRRGTGRCEALRPLGTAQPLVHSSHADDLDSKVITTVTTGGGNESMASMGLRPSRDAAQLTGD